MQKIRVTHKDGDMQGITLKKIQFSKRMRDIYSSDGKELEVIDNIITEVR